MKRINRRSFFEWFAAPPGSDAPATVSRGEPAATATGAPCAAPHATADATSSTPALTSGFSLEAFYAARGPQKLPPITIRPSVLHHAHETTRVGCPPPHAPPSLEGDPLYAHLAAAAVTPRKDDESAG